MLTDFQILSLTDIALNFWQKSDYTSCHTSNAPLYRMPCEIFVLKNRHAPEKSGANCHAKLSHWKQLLKNIHQMMLA